MTDTLFNLDVYATSSDTPVYDPYWDEIVLDCSGKVEQDGQLTLFYDDLAEPPDPDDFLSLAEYEQAWSDWEKKYPELAAEIQSRTFPEQVNNVLEEVQGAFPEQVNNVLEEVQGAFPEHHKQWVERYFVTRAGTKHWYYRYCYYDKKIHHIHINGGNTSSKVAQRRKLMVEEAISSGKSPAEIKKLVKGVFGL